MYSPYLNAGFLDLYQLLPSMLSLTCLMPAPCNAYPIILKLQYISYNTSIHSYWIIIAKIYICTRAFHFALVSTQRHAYLFRSEIWKERLPICRSWWTIPSLHMSEWRILLEQKRRRGSPAWHHLHPQGHQRIDPTPYFPAVLPGCSWEPLPVVSKKGTFN